MQHFKLLFLLFIFALSPGTGLQAQDESETTTYYKVIKLKDLNGNLMDVERQLMLPLSQERVNRGEMLWHGLYRVKYPSPHQAGYKYVAVAIHNDFAHLELGNQNELLQSALPDASPAKMWERLNEESEIYSSEVFVGIDGIPISDNKQSKFVRVNYMDVMPGKEGAYVEMESDLWKPVHAAQIKKGALNNWLLVERIMPGGSDFGPGYITVDGFADWPQIEKNNQEMFASAESVYPGEDLEKKLGAISDLRSFARAEMWELVASTTAPSKEEVAIKVTEAGTGPHAMRGQTVAFDIQVIGTDGKTFFDNQKMVGIPIQTVVGGDPYNPHGSKILTRTGKGGKVEVDMPLSRQPLEMRINNGNQDLKMKFHILEVGSPATDGTVALKEMILADDLSAAKKWHASVKADETYVFQEWPMNLLGYELMEKGHNEGALYVLAENQRAHPRSFNAHDSLADAYRAAGNHLMAAKHYQQALQINPDATASKGKLAELRK